MHTIAWGSPNVKRVPFDICGFLIYTGLVAVPHPCSIGRVSVEETNKKVFTKGLILGTLLTSLSVLISICKYISDPSIGYDGFTIFFLYIPLMPIIFSMGILVVCVIHGWLYLILYIIQTRRTIDISGIRWFFYGFEICLSLVIGILFHSYLYSGRWVDYFGFAIKSISISLLFTAIAGAIVWIVVARLLGKKEAEEGSS